MIYTLVYAITVMNAVMVVPIYNGEVIPNTLIHNHNPNRLSG